jgi:predicted transcriptional regulator
MIKIHYWDDNTVCFPEDESLEEYISWKSDDFQTLEFHSYEDMEKFLTEIRYHDY